MQRSDVMVRYLDTTKKSLTSGWNSKQAKVIWCPNHIGFEVLFQTFVCLVWCYIRLMSSLHKLEVGHIRPKNQEMYHKLNSVVQHKVSKSFTSWRKWSWRCQQESSRRSQGMRWCWIQDRGQRALQGRPRSPQDPFWCFAQTLRKL